MKQTQVREIIELLSMELGIKIRLQDNGSENYVISSERILSKEERFRDLLWRSRSRLKARQRKDEILENKERYPALFAAVSSKKGAIIIGLCLLGTFVSSLAMRDIIKMDSLVEEAKRIIRGEYK